MARAAKQSPAFIIPMAARLAESLPTGADWGSEVKLDGYGALLLKDVIACGILSRNAKDLTAWYPAVLEAAQHLKAQQALLDGEIAALDEKGLPSFHALLHPSPQTKIMYFPFVAVLRILAGDHTSGASANHSPAQRPTVPSIQGSAAV